MARYTVIGWTDASASVEVEAETPEQAAEEGSCDLDFSVCHQCAREINVSGDVVFHRVLDEEGEEAWAEDPHDPDVVRRERDEARAEVERLRAAVEAATAAVHNGDLAPRSVSGLALINALAALDTGEQS